MTLTATPKPKQLNNNNKTNKNQTPNILNSYNEQLVIYSLLFSAWTKYCLVHVYTIIMKMNNFSKIFIKFHFSADHSDVCHRHEAH